MEIGQGEAFDTVDALVTQRSKQLVPKKLGESQSRGGKSVSGYQPQRNDVWPRWERPADRHRLSAGLLAEMIKEQAKSDES
ncbi:hypothetical protein MACH17_01640 [Phaeobacter inhibens]|uniref:hypothetical protein n=1 Tax=Phaeobacter inhibens TaxID=221822 RepID=UPI0027723098|nr:hypothetical protein [Phaeobacter inhibens]GLO68647.1 hypothetical protein MACH17_01640 [Phaeobacter inhibens]